MNNIALFVIFLYDKNIMIHGKIRERKNDIKNLIQSDYKKN